MKIIKYLYPALLLLIVALISVLNYTPGTWLTGWDNLHPEFDFKMNILRSVFSVWQEYQGLGLMAGMAHASDLPRQLFMWGLSLVIPISFLRYFFHFLMLATGTVGLYVFLKKIIPSRFVSFLGALFYLLNLGTIQYFYVPFEPYSTFWGLFPWEMWILFSYLKEPSKKNLGLFIFINLIAIPQAYVQTIFLVYVLSVASILAVYFFKNKTKETFQKVILLFSIIFCLNAFWLLPNLYFTLSDVKVTQNAMNNRMNTDRFFEENKRRGTLDDFSLLKEFYFDFQDYDADHGKLTFMMSPWRDHFAFPLIPAIGYAAFGITLLGIFKKSKYRPYFIALFGLSLFAFLSNVIVFSEINTVLRGIPIVNQMFRNPFTKFIVPTIFIFAVGFGYGLSIIANYIKKDETRRIVYAGIFVMVCIYSWPVFTGNLFYKSVKAQIPTEYFALFQYMNTQDKTARIANLPQDSYWGWGSYKWGVTGSGFLWYGLAQPVMDRAFDVWSEELEGYYWELHYALKKQDQNALNAVLDKYHIDYVLFDQNYTPSDSMQTKYLLKEESLLTNNPRVEIAKKFGNVTLYRFNLSEKKNQNVIVQTSLPSAASRDSYMHDDVIFSDLGPYQSKQENNTYLYPFRAIFTNRFKGEQSYDLTEDSSHFILKSNLPKGSYLLSVPSYSSEEQIVPVEVMARRNNGKLEIRLVERQPVIEINGQRLAPPNKSYDFSFTDPDDGFIVQLNDQEYISIRNLTISYKKYGDSYFKNDPLEKKLKLYSLDTASKSSVSLQNFAQAQSCSSSSQPDITYKSTVTKDGLTLEGKNTTVCSTYKDKLTSPYSDALIKLEMDYQSQTDEFPKYCMYSDTLVDCINNKNEIIAGFSHTKKQVIDFMEYEEDTDDKTSLNLILDPYSTNNDSSKQITYSNVSLTYYEKLEEVPIVTSDSPTGARYEVRTDVPSTMTVTIPKHAFSHALKDIVSTNQYKLSETSYNELFSKNYYIQTLEDDQAVRLYARDTFVNFWIDLKDIDPHEGSLITLDSRKKAGFPLILNISTIKDQTKYIYTQIPSGPDFVRSYFVVPPANEFDAGYQILFNNTSLNNGMTVHDIKGLSIYPFPYHFLQGINVKDLSQPTDNTSNQVEGFTVEKINTGLYSVENIDKKGILTLSQSYHDGWMAFVTKNPNTIYFPFINTTLNEHVKVNNWANGWMVPKLQSDESIILVFWPQYLEYLGFMMILIPALFLLLYKNPDQKD